MDNPSLVDDFDLPLNTTSINTTDTENVDCLPEFEDKLLDTVIKTEKESPAAAPAPPLKGGKQLNAEKKITNSNPDDKTNCKEPTELLGSVTTHTCPGTRTSARVIQKMKLDLTRPTTPPIATHEGKKDEKTIQKTPSQVRTNRPTWSNLERNYFFDALNEFGKDFESLGNYINAKLKRKSSTDISYKTKEQVRQHYYQTFHKICKYVRFSEETKKLAQELYALINYGEMRRKLQFVTDKHFMKLKQLVYQGHITVRCKGKNIRIKTPSCKALRKLNQLDDSLEDIRLPSKIEVIVSPANMESFGRVQSIAQNPRVRTTVPLHKKLNTFIKTFEYKWRGNDVKLNEEASKISLIDMQTNVVDAQQQQQGMLTFQESPMCFLPKPGVAIHRPLLSITEYLSSLNLCLTAYEERMGIKVRSETLSLERFSHKRQRTESGSEKRSPETKKVKQLLTPPYERQLEENSFQLDTQLIKEELPNAIETPVQEIDMLQQHKSESSGDELSDEPHDQLQNNLEMLLLKEEPGVLCVAGELQQIEGHSATQTAAQQARSKRAANMRAMRSTLNFKPLVSDEIIKRIRKGWTAASAVDITIGDLYVVLGQDSRLELDYYWLDTIQSKPMKSTECASNNATNSSLDTELKTTNLRLPYNRIVSDDAERVRHLSAAVIGSKLKHLLIIANLSERLRKRQCSCGHICERNAAKGRFDRDLIGKSFVSTKAQCMPPVEFNNSTFRQPPIPTRRQMFGVDPVKQLSTLTRQKMSRQVLVQRLILPGGGNQSSIDLPELKTLQDERNQLALFYSEPQSAAATTNDTTYSARTDEQQAMKRSSDDDEDNYDEDEIDGGTHKAKTNDAAGYADNSDEKHGEAKYSSQTTVAPPTGAYDESTNTSILNGMMSPMHFFRESTSNSRWLEENLNDFSLTSLLGHLDEINATRDALNSSSNISVISESSVDFRHKFQEITALLQSQDKE